MYKKQNRKAIGSSLIAVIIITVVSITVVGAMVILVSLVLMTTVGWQKSADALFAAESYADDYILRIVRNPNAEVDPSESFSMNGAVVTQTLFSAPEGQPNILFIKSKAGGYARTIRIVYIVEDGKVTVLDRLEHLP